MQNDLNELLAELRRTGQQPDRALLDRVREQGAVAVPALIAMAVDETLHYAEEQSPEVWAPLHAIQILGELGAAEAVEPLIPLLSWDDDWLKEGLAECFGRIGGPALQPLRAFLFDRTHDIYARAAAGEGLVRIARYHPDLRKEVVDALRARLDPAESQVPEDETLNGFVVCQLRDLEAEEAVPAIVRAYQEDRVDRRVVGLDDVRDKLDVPVEALPTETTTVPAAWNTGMRLWLRCTACGYEREHQVEKVYCDLTTQKRRARGEETPYSEFVIPQRITCPKCGASDQYELTSYAHLAITAELTKMAVRAENPHLVVDQGEGPLILRRFVVAGDREMHPYEARDMYRQQVEAEPDRADLRTRYGNVLQLLGRGDEAGAQYRAALQLDPLSVEACVNLGALALDAGDHREARHLFERVLELVPRSKVDRRQREDYLRFAHEALAELAAANLGASRTAKGVPAIQARGHWGPREERVAAAPARGAGKVGRNDPCPCGSGKKYKKCCGR